MKKILTMLIIFCMFCSGSQTMASSVKKNNVQLLVDLGIADEEIKAGLNQPIKRIDFVDMFSTIETAQNVSAGFVLEFTDIDATASYGKALEWLCLIGAVANGESFYPDENITYEQAAKIMVSVLGYGKEAEIEGGYPKGYLNVASRLDLLKGVSVEFTAADACRMFENALEVSTVISGKMAYAYEDTEMTMLERYYCTSYKKGKMTKNTLTSLLEELSDSSYTIAVDEDEFTCDNRYDNLIGREVFVYYKTEGIHEDEVVGIYETDKNNIVNFKIDEDTQFSNFTYTVDVRGKFKNYSINRAVDVIYNGRIYTTYSESDLLPINGDIALIDMDRDKKYETVIINSYENYFAANGTGDGIIYDAMGKSFIDTNEDVDLIVCENGKEVQLSAITAGMLLEVRMSKGEERKLIQIDLCREVVSGKITAVDASYKTVIVEDTEYKILESLRKMIVEDSTLLDKMVIGKMISLYFDNSGNVGYYEIEKNESEFYTYLRKVTIYDEGIEDTVLFRIMMPDGTWKTVEAGKKMEYDGEKRKKAELISFVKNDGITANRPVRCKLDASGNVIKMESLEKFDVGYDRLVYKRSSRSFDGFCSIANDCTVFIVPGAGYEDDESMYELKNAGYFGEGQKYNMQLYEVGDELIADVVLIPGNGKETSIPDEEEMLIVKKAVMACIDDEVCAEIIAYTPQGEYRGVTKDETVEFCDRITGKYLTFDHLQDGDVIRVLRDNSGKIIKGERIVDIKKFKVNKYSGVYLTTGGFRDGSMHRGGYVYTIKDGIMTVPKIANPDFTSEDIRRQLFVHSAQAPSIMVYDVEEKTVRNGSSEDIIAYKDYEKLNITSFVYFITSLGDPRSSMIIFK